MTTTDLVVIGGGPHGLAVLAALAARPGAWPGEVVVVDPSGTWCAAWDDKVARLALDRLRSPQVHHPGPRPMELRDLVEARPQAERAALRREEDERVPTPAGMRLLLDQLIAGLGPLRLLSGRVARLAPQDADSVAHATTLVELEDGRTLSARSVVLAHNPSLPRLPGVPGAADRVAVHASAVDLRTEPGLSGDSEDPGQLPLRLAEPAAGDRHVAIVGGGLTAGTLALAVTARGGRATLLTRRPLRARPYDVDAAWLGPRRLAGFAEASPIDRRAMIDEARDGGTMPAATLEALRARDRTPGSGLVIREAVDVPAELAGLLAEAGVGGTDEVPPALRPEDAGGPADIAPPIDAVWLATGFRNDVADDPLVQPLVEHHGIVVHGGLPEVTDDLRLPGTGIFVVGPYAALAVGPAARNLSGARPAAARVAAAIAAR